MGAKNHRKYLQKHPGPPFQIRGGPGSFSIAEICQIFRWFFGKFKIIKKRQFLILLQFTYDYMDYLMQADLMY